MIDIDDVWIKGKELCVYIYMNNFGCVFDGLILTNFLCKNCGVDKRHWVIDVGFRDDSWAYTAPK